MAVTNKDLNLTIKSKYSGTGAGTAIKDLNKFASVTEKLNKSQKSQLTGIASAWKSVSSAFRNVFSGMISGLGSIFNALFSVKTLIMGLFAGIVGKGIGAFLSLNAEFEKMKVTMDVLTKGQGEAWFNKLNQWALDMPVSMSEVTKSFITMRAYGLTPTIKMMENLLDVASVLPESGRAMTGIARALGQIQSKGRLEGQELRQLAEWAVPGYEAVYDKIFKNISARTGKSVHDLKFTMIDAATANKAILETMEEHFGGAAKAIAKTWGGLWIRLTNHAKDFFRQIGESGAMQPLKQGLEKIVNWMSGAFKSGEMQKATGIIGSSFGIIFEDITKSLSGMDVKDWSDKFVSALKIVIYTVAVLSTAIDSIKLILLIVKLGFLNFSIGVNVILYGVIGVINEVIQHFKWVIDRVPAAIAFLIGPAFGMVKKAFDDFTPYTTALAEGQGVNVTLLGQSWAKTGLEIVATTKHLGDGFWEANELALKLDGNLQKLKVSAAVPPKPSTVTGDGGDGLSEYERERKALLESVTSQEKGWGKGWMSDMETSIIDNASAWEQVKYAFLAYEKEGLKGATFKRFQKVFNDFTDSLKTGYSSAMTGMIRGTMNFKNAINSIVDTIRAAFINVVTDMVAEWLAGQTRMLLGYIFFQKAKTAATAEGEAERLVIEKTSMLKSVAIAIAGAIKKIMIFAYQAAAAVYNAFAFIPLIGPALGVAAVAGTLALVMGFAKKVASFEKGTGLEGVKQTGPAVLHKGEIVLNKKESDAYRAGAMDNGGQTTSNNYNMSFTISSMDSEDMERVVRKKIIPLIRSNIKDNGKAKTMIREAI